MSKDVLENPEDTNYKILVCIDGTEESYRGLRYAMRLGSGGNTDITLLYIRPIDKQHHTGGLHMRMARENMLEWGLELPGMASLKRARDLLVEADYLDDNWGTKTSHVDIKGDPLGDNSVEYTSEKGCKVLLKLMVSPSPDIGILEEGEMGNYDIIIVSSSDTTFKSFKSIFLNDSVSQVIATESKNTVIVAKALEESHGHLLCLSGSESSLRMAKRDAILASRCFCPIYLFHVAKDESEMVKAKSIITKARKIIESAGYAVSGEKIVIGDPVEKIVEEGQNYSLTVLSGEHKLGFRRFFKSSFTYRILEKAQSSVMMSR
jgi:nucleotide-binding universal stress UspA family protein